MSRFQFRQRINRRPRLFQGNTLIFIVACAFVIILIGLGLFKLSQIMGGGVEVANAVDAGALNVGRQVFSLKTDVSTNDRDEQQYADVADKGKSFSLSNINRLWAKCLLCDMNAEAMKKAGQSNATSDAHASAMHSAGYQIEKRLFDLISDSKSIAKFFDDLAAQESVKMLGSKTSVKSDTKGLSTSGWSSRRMDQGVESNIVVEQDQLPTGFTLEKIGAMKASDNKYYFKGYSPIEGIKAEPVCFVPFKLNAQPHLVSGKEFSTSNIDLKGISSNPLPNAFSCQGKTEGQQGAAESSKSFVLINPQKTYQMEMPHGFIKIKFENNIAHWNINVSPPQGQGSASASGQAQGGIAGAGVLPGGAAVTGGALVPRAGAGLISQDGAGVAGRGGAGLISQDGAGLSGRGGAGLISQDGAGLSGRGGAGLISQDGAGLSGRGGAGLISQDGAGVSGRGGAGLISQDGAGVSGRGAGLISQDGAGLVQRAGAGLISQDGAGLSSRGGAGLISQDGAGLVGKAKLVSDNGAGLTGVGNASGLTGGGRHLMSLDGPGPANGAAPGNSPNSPNSQMPKSTQVQQTQSGGASTSAYGFAPEQQNRSYPYGTDTMQVQAFLGNEYSPPTLKQAVFSLNGDYTAIIAALCQRIREIKPGFKDADLNKLLEACSVAPGVNEYILALDDKGELKVQSSSQAQEKFSWLNPANSADGNEKGIGSDSAASPNRATVSPQSLHASASTYGSMFWKPGTGYDGCLGELRIQRQTDINVTN